MRFQNLIFAAAVATALPASLNTERSTDQVGIRDNNTKDNHAIDSREKESKNVREKDSTEKDSQVQFDGIISKREKDSQEKDSKDIRGDDESDEDESDDEEVEDAGVESDSEAEDDSEDDEDDEDVFRDTAKNKFKEIFESHRSKALDKREKDSHEKDSMDARGICDGICGDDFGLWDESGTVSGSKTTKSKNKRPNKTQKKKNNSLKSKFQNAAKKAAARLDAGEESEAEADDSESETAKKVLSKPKKVLTKPKKALAKNRVNRKTKTQAQAADDSADESDSEDDVTVAARIKDNSKVDKKASQNAAAKSEDAAAKSKTAAQESKDIAKESASKLKDAVKKTEDAAKKTVAAKANGTSEADKKASENAAAKSEDSAAKSEDAAAKSEDAAAKSKTAAQQSEDVAEESVSKIQDAAKKTEGAAQDVAKKVEGDAQDSVGQTGGAAQDAAQKIEGAAQDAAQKIEGAAQDASEETKSAAKDSVSQTEGTNNKGGQGAVADVKNVADNLEGAIKQPAPKKVITLDSAPEDSPAKDSASQDTATQNSAAQGSASNKGGSGKAETKGSLQGAAGLSKSDTKNERRWLEDHIPVYLHYGGCQSGDQGDPNIPDAEPAPEELPWKFVPKEQFEFPRPRADTSRLTARSIFRWKIPKDDTFLNAMRNELREWIDQLEADENVPKKDKKKLKKWCEDVAIDASVLKHSITQAHKSVKAIKEALAAEAIAKKAEEKAKLAPEAKNEKAPRGSESGESRLQRRGDDIVDVPTALGRRIDRLEDNRLATPEQRAHLKLMRARLIEVQKNRRKKIYHLWVALTKLYNHWLVRIRDRAQKDDRRLQPLRYIPVRGGSIVRAPVDQAAAGSETTKKQKRWGLGFELPMDRTAHYPCLHGIECGEDNLDKRWQVTDMIKEMEKNELTNEDERRDLRMIRRKVKEAEDELMQLVGELSAEATLVGRQIDGRWKGAQKKIFKKPTMPPGHKEVELETFKNQEKLDKYIQETYRKQAAEVTKANELSKRGLATIDKGLYEGIDELDAIKQIQDKWIALQEESYDNLPSSADLEEIAAHKSAMHELEKKITPGSPQAKALQEMKLERISNLQHQLNFWNNDRWRKRKISAIKEELKELIQEQKKMERLMNKAEKAKLDAAKEAAKNTALKNKKYMDETKDDDLFSRRAAQKELDRIARKSELNGKIQAGDGV